METYLFWLIAGFVLVIAELLTGTFYLVVLGVAAFVGAGAAWVGWGLHLQAVVAAVVAVAGVFLVRRKSLAREPAMASLDAGQVVVIERWIDRAAGRARVRYRDTQWDAEVDGSIEGETYYVVTVTGNTLRISSRRPG